MDAFDIGNLLPSAGPAAIFLVIIGVLLKLWLSAEKRYTGELTDLRARVEALSKQVDDERKLRRDAEDAAAAARRKGGGVDA